MPDVNKLTGAFPSLQEQQTIVNTVFRQKDEFVRAAERAESMLDLLAERRTALISAAVTGKIDVRGWKPPEGVAEEQEGA
jgi:type I restriction enzyme S subunit